MKDELLIAAGFAVLLTTVLVWLFKQPAHRYGLLDHPDLRKQHLGTVPLVGGLAMCLAFSFSVLILMPAQAPAFAVLLAGGYMMMAAGLVDDLREVSILMRFTLQIVGVLIIVVAGSGELRNLGDLLGQGDVLLGMAAVPFTLFAVVGIINAFNMADGLDGLAGGLALIALIYLGLLAAAAGMTVDLHLLAMVGGCVAGFLFYNLRHPWRDKAGVFMGDSGSMFLGFVLAWFSIRLSQASVPALAPIAAVWILGLPILDTVYAMVARLLRGENPFSGGRDHLHYLLVDSGLSVTRSVWILLGVSAVLGGVGVLGMGLEWNESSLFYLFLGVAGLYSVIRLYIGSLASRRLGRPLS